MLNSLATAAIRWSKAESDARKATQNFILYMSILSIIGVKRQDIQLIKLDNAEKRM